MHLLTKLYVLLKYIASTSACLCKKSFRVDHLVMRRHSNGVITTIESHKLRFEKNIPIDLKTRGCGLHASETSCVEI
jgi:hypothetical protein